MLFSPGVPVFHGIAACQVQYFDRYFCFRQSTVPGNGFHYIPVPVARSKIHQGINTGSIFSEYLLYTAQCLYKFTPVCCTNKTECTDAVSYRDLVGSLFLIFLLYKIITA